MNLPTEVARDIVRHMEWADARTWAAALGHAPSAGDPGVRGYLSHLHQVQQLFLTLWEQRPPSEFVAVATATFPSLPELRTWVQPYYPRVHQFLAGADESVMSRLVRMPGLEPYEQQLGITFAPTSIGETVFQVASHTTHHRAQVLSRLRALGGEPPLVDYIGWVWFGRPEPEWQPSAA
jgi:uncharacterized damage-inducible protein DinB